MNTIYPSSPPPFAAIIVAAGQGQRFGGDIPKQYAKINGKTVLRYAVEAFKACGSLLSDIRIVIDPQHENLYQEAVKGLDLPAPVYGGTERKDSVYNALISLPHLAPDHAVLIHDGARPCLTAELIRHVLDALKDHKAATLAIPATDTLRRLDQGVLDETVNRTGLWALQTPQGFHYDTILKAHISARKLRDITDDTGVVSAYGEDVYMVPGSHLNIKITNPEDIFMATSLLGSQMQTVTRTAMGYDVHALVPGNGMIRLGGIDIPHEKKLLGHSDADVVLHAVTDALLGTISAGDIGTHFPPSDMTFKNMDSAVFVRKAVELISEHNGAIVHMDITILAERPKLAPHRIAMQENIARLLSLPLSSVSLKATTTEGLGFTGREEGIVAQAIATARFPL
jgi:2-C-methyl-D-erythritol 4-phosphate cytidylyltransferase/2-C-methyl-D-erythritol 2,4-cyclodiphosphate synthase